MELPYERSAMHNEPMPEGLDLADQLCYQALALLYARYHSGKITREQGEKEARMIRRKREENVKSNEFGEKCREHAVKLWKDIEQSANAYRKKRTIENADKLIAAIYGVGFVEDKIQSEETR